MSASKQLAEAYLYELFNDADHVVKLVENARESIKHGDFADALENLHLANRPASLIEMRLRSAQRAVTEARDTEGIQP